MVLSVIGRYFVCNYMFTSRVRNRYIVGRRGAVACNLWTRNAKNFTGWLIRPKPCVKSIHKLVRTIKYHYVRLSIYQVVARADGSIIIISNIHCVVSNNVHLLHFIYSVGDLSFLYPSNMFVAYIISYASCAIISTFQERIRIMAAALAHPKRREESRKGKREERK